MTETIKGSQAAIRQLIAEGVQVVLGIPGTHSLHLCDAVLDHPHLQFVTGRHEQGITFMANGYARASGKIAVPIVISGPGVTNSLTSLADARTDSVPMVLIAAQPERARWGKGAFHELRDQTGALASVTKWNTRVEHVQEIPGAIRSAFHHAYEGRPGPTAVEIPMDVQMERGSVDILPSQRPARLEAEREGIRHAAKLLASSTSPLVYVGRGASLSGCTGELLQLIERLQAPCFMTPLAKGTIPDDHPLSLSWGGRYQGHLDRFLAEADVVLVVGSSLDEADTGSDGLPFPERVIQIDTCREVIGRTYPVSVGLVGDARAALRQILSELSHIEQPVRQSPAARIAEYIAQSEAGVRDEPGWQFMDAIQQALPRDAVVTNDASRANGWAIFYLKRSLPNTFNITGNLGALGYAFPAAVGAKLAYPERQALAIVGDGGFQFTLFSLGTAVQHRINAVAVVFNDACYGRIKRMQDQHFGRTIGADLPSPDFVRLAEAFGAVGCQADDPQQLYDALVAAWQRDVPTVIEVPIEEQRARRS